MILHHILVSIIISFLIWISHTFHLLDKSPNIIGNWISENKYKRHNLNFSNDYSCSLIIYDKRTNSKQEIVGTFEIDYNKHPFPLSIRNIPQLNFSLHTIIEMKDVNSLKIADFSPRWKLRPISFNKNNHTNFKRLIFKNT